MVVVNIGGLIPTLETRRLRRELILLAVVHATTKVHLSISTTMRT